MKRPLYLVRKHDFSPEEIHALSVAYENVCAAVVGANHAPEVRLYIAEQIIQLATAGEHDATQLYLKCLNHYQNKHLVQRVG